MGRRDVPCHPACRGTRWWRCDRATSAERLCLRSDRGCATPAAASPARRPQPRTRTPASGSSAPSAARDAVPAGVPGPRTHASRSRLRRVPASAQSYYTSISLPSRLWCLQYIRARDSLIFATCAPSRVSAISPRPPCILEPPSVHPAYSQEAERIFRTPFPEPSNDDPPRSRGIKFLTVNVPRLHYLDSCKLRRSIPSLYPRIHFECRSL